MSLPFDYARDTRSHQVFDKDPKNYFIENMISVDDLIDTNNFQVITSNPQTNMGNRLVRHIDSVYTLYYAVTNIIPLLITIEYFFINLNSVVLDSLIQDQVFNIQVLSSTAADGMVAANLQNQAFSNQRDKIFTILPRSNGLNPIPALSTFIGSIDLLPRGSIEKLLI